jgi:phospho-N-acetylmuramoyl-pentapeptide-transferase
VFVILAASSNAVNLTDGLDGLASGASILVLSAFVFIAFWQFRHTCEMIAGAACYPIDGHAALDLAIVTNTQLLLVVLGGLFVIEASSVIAQVIAFRGFKRRIFRMSPIHHHFELAGWPEFTVIVRFWIVTGLLVAVGLGLFYTDFVSRGGLGLE